MWSTVLSAFACVLFGYAGYWSIRLAYADRIATDRSRPTTERAIHIAPLNPEYYILLGDADRTTALASAQKAAALNPLDSSMWLEIARAAEEQKDFQRAERSLLHAIQLDRTFAPRWLAAEYYSRRRDQVHFWLMMRAALATSYDDVSRLFDLCWPLATDPVTILEQAIPDRGDVLEQYLNYVLAKDRLDLAGPVAERLMQHPAANTGQRLLDYCNRLLEKSKTSEALKVWNWLSARRMVEYPALLPEKGVSITNGGFEKPFLSRAFDWRLSDPPGISARRIGPAGGLRVSFSGKQPQTCEILSEFVPLVPERKYRLRIRYETTKLDRETGLSWSEAATRRERLN